MSERQDGSTDGRRIIRHHRPLDRRNCRHRCRIWLQALVQPPRQILDEIGREPATNEYGLWIDQAVDGQQGLEQCLDRSVDPGVYDALSARIEPRQSAGR